MKNSLIIGEILCFLAMSCSTLSSLVHPFVLTCGEVEGFTDDENLLCTFDFFNYSAKKVVSIEIGFRIFMNLDYVEFDTDLNYVDCFRKVPVEIEPSENSTFTVNVNKLNFPPVEDFQNCFVGNPEVCKINYADGTSWICSDSSDPLLQLLPDLY